VIFRSVVVVCKGKMYISTTSHKSQAEGGTSIFLFPTFNRINTISTPKKTSLPVVFVSLILA
jgi:hypothetical protein